MKLDPKNSSKQQHIIKQFVTNIYLERFREAEEIAILNKDIFVAEELYAAAKKYHYGSEGLMPNYQIAKALYEWAHSEQWLACYMIEGLKEPPDSLLYKSCKIINEDSFVEWSEAVKAGLQFDSQYIHNYEYDDSESICILITGALLGCKKSISILKDQARNEQDHFEAWGVVGRWGVHLEKILENK